MQNKKKLIRITTVPSSLKILLRDQLRFMDGNFEVVAVSSPDQELEDVALEQGVRTHAIEMLRKIAPIRDMRSLIRMYLFLRREKPHIVHSHTPKAGLIGMVAARLAGVRHRLHTVAGMPLMEATGIKKSLLIAVEKITYRCATAVMPNSRGLMDYIISKNIARPHKLHMIGNGSSNGINLDFFAPSDALSVQGQALRERYAVSSKSCIFLFLGRIVGDKGINELVAAFNMLSQKYTGIKLLLVGRQEDELDPLDGETLNSLRCNDDIIVCGHQKDVRPFLAMSDIFVFPSYREGFPNVVLQACSFGLPCIVSNINGNNEIIRNGENGLIVEPKKITALYEAMEKLLCDDELRKKFSGKSRVSICERYSQAFVWQELYTFYINLNGSQ